MKTNKRLATSTVCKIFCKIVCISSIIKKKFTPNLYLQNIGVHPIKKKKKKIYIYI